MRRSLRSALLIGALVGGALGLSPFLAGLPASAANIWLAVQEPSLSSLSPAPNTNTTAMNHSLQGVACVSAGDCTAVGSYYDSNDHTDALIETESDGTWSTIQEPSLSSLLPSPIGGVGAVLNSISCVSIDDCTAVGRYGDADNDTNVLIETETSGSWSAVQEPSLSSLSPVPKGSPFAQEILTSVSCTSASDCTAVGWYRDSSGGEDPLIESESSGTWSAMEPPSLSSLTPLPSTDQATVVLEGVSCTSASDCTAVGYYEDTNLYGEPLIETESSGVWGAVQEPSLSSLSPAPVEPGGNLAAISCTSAGDCTAVGAYNANRPDNVLIETESSGTWSAVQQPSLSSLSPGPGSSVGEGLAAVSCTSSTDCTATSQYQDVNGNFDPLIETDSSGSWSAVQEPSMSSLLPASSSTPNATLGAVSCGSATVCTAVGVYTNTYNLDDSLIETDFAYPTVSFNSDGGVAVASLVGPPGSSITLPSDNYPGYTFDGWFTAATGGTEVGGAGSFYTIPADGAALYAQWTAIDDYSYAAGGGNGTAPASGSGLDGTTITLAANTFTRAGYSFAGWSDGTAPYAAGATYTLSSEGNPILFTAQWAANPTDAYSYAPNGGTGTVPASGSGLDGTTITLAANALSDPGYSFAGWSDGTATYSAGDAYTLSSEGNPVVFTAQWTENFIDTVAFDSDGGAAVSSLRGPDGSVVALPSDTRPGYIFDGWFTAAKGGPVAGIAGTSYIIPPGGFTFFAQWTKMSSQTITFAKPANETLAQSQVTVSATASSGLTVTFTTRTPSVCTPGGAIGATITLVNAGSCTVEASQVGDNVYNAAKPVSRTFKVSKVSQTITFGPLTNETLAQSPVAISATASSGLPVTVSTSTAAVCTSGGVNGATITLLKAGTCILRASQVGNTVYNATKAEDTFTVG